jgi:hypothetical protein
VRAQTWLTFQRTELWLCGQRRPIHSAAVLHVQVAGLAILFLMIAKPATGESLLVLALASMVTIATSLTRRPTTSTAVQGYR